MSTYNFVSTESARPKHFESSQYQLVIRQQPDRARVCNQKERDRRPVDPPPIIQLKVADDSEEAQNYLQSPYFFMCANLQHANDDGQVVPAIKALAGTIVSSLHRLKDIDNSDGGFFVFGDLSIKLEGKYRLRFSLFEIIKEDVIHVKSVTSGVFEVFSPKNFPGMSESTFLSRSFSDQGVRIRIRKEHRIAMKRAPIKPTTDNGDGTSLSSGEGSAKRKRSRQVSEQVQYDPNQGYNQPPTLQAAAPPPMHHGGPTPIAQSYPHGYAQHPTEYRTPPPTHPHYQQAHPAAYEEEQAKRQRTTPPSAQPHAQPQGYNPPYYGTRYDNIAPRPYPGYGYQGPPPPMHDPYYYPPQQYGAPQYRYDDPRAGQSGPPQQPPQPPQPPPPQHAIPVHAGAVPIAPHGYDPAQGQHATYAYGGQYAPYYGRPPAGYAAPPPGHGQPQGPPPAQEAPPATSKSHAANVRAAVTHPSPVSPHHPPPHQGPPGHPVHAVHPGHPHPGHPDPYAGYYAQYGNRGPPPGYAGGPPAPYQYAGPPPGPQGGPAQRSPHQQQGPQAPNGSPHAQSSPTGPPTSVSLPGISSFSGDNGQSRKYSQDSAARQNGHEESE